MDEAEGKLVWSDIHDLPPNYLQSRGHQSLFAPGPTTVSFNSQAFTTDWLSLPLQKHFFPQISLKPSQFEASLSYADNVNMLGINLNISQKIRLRTLKFHKTCLRVNKNSLQTISYLNISKNHFSFLNTFSKQKLRQFVSFVKSFFVIMSFLICLLYNY